MLPGARNTLCWRDDGNLWQPFGFFRFLPASDLRAVAILPALDYRLEPPSSVQSSIFINLHGPSKMTRLRLFSELLAKAYAPQIGICQQEGSVDDSSIPEGCRDDGAWRMRSPSSVSSRRAMYGNVSDLCGDKGCSQLNRLLSLIERLRNVA